MNNLDIDSLFQDALNYESFETFKYQWNYQEGDNKGELLLFFLKIKNLNEQKGDKTIEIDIFCAFGPRYFKVTNGVLPVAGS